MPNPPPMPPSLPLAWTFDRLSCLEQTGYATAPVLKHGQVQRISPDLDVWDAWPLADRTGVPVKWRGGQLWFALAAPAFDDPEQRHNKARIHHFHRVDDQFEHLGATFPDGFTPGSREWSGSARCDDGRHVTLFFTAAGERGEEKPTYKQRLFASTTQIADGVCTDAPFERWADPGELFVPLDILYMSNHDGAGEPGEIKAFRDPFTWCTEEGREHLLLTASSARTRHRFNGVIGCAVRNPDGVFYRVPPLVDASGLNNELERPHMVAHDGKLYLFWSTQARVVAPAVSAPTGLYGAVADRIEGPWRFLNEHGLVFANPQSEPFQAYSWWVLPDLSVASFVDYWGIDDASRQEKPKGRAHFGGTFAPFLQLRLDGARATLDNG